VLGRSRKHLSSSWPGEEVGEEGKKRRAEGGWPTGSATFASPPRDLGRTITAALRGSAGGGSGGSGLRAKGAEHISRLGIFRFFSFIIFFFFFAGSARRGRPYPRSIVTVLRLLPRTIAGRKRERATEMSSTHRPGRGRLSPTPFPRAVTTGPYF
jgi:hypothetical protein